MGFPRKFNQGLATLAVTSHGLVELAADGDPGGSGCVGVRFVAPTFPSDDIEVSVDEIGRSDAGVLAYAFEASAAGRALVRHGRVEVAPA